jgi:hypothetical protein
MNLLQELPKEILIDEIIKKLTIKDIKNLHETSKYFHEIVDNMMEARANHSKKELDNKENKLIMIENKRYAVLIKNFDENNQLRKTIEFEKIDLWK